MLLLSRMIELSACIAGLSLYLYFCNGVFQQLRSYKSFVFPVLAALYIFFTYNPGHILSDIVSSLLGVMVMVLITSLFHSTNHFIRIVIPIIYNMCDITITTMIYFVLGRLFCLSVLDNSIESILDRLYYLLSIYLLEFIILYIMRQRIKIHTFISESFARKLAVPLFLIDFIIIILAHVTLYYYVSLPPLFELCCLFICLFMLLASFLFLFLLRRLELQYKELQEKQLLGLHLSEQGKRLVQLQKSIDSLHAIRHDFKKYLQNYQTLLQTGNISAVEYSISEILQSRLISPAQVYTDNPMINSILASCMEQCLQHNIEFKVRVVVPKSYYDIETMVTLSNLIDNAIEAEKSLVSSERFIILEITEVKDSLSMIIQNKIDQSVLKVNPKLRTTKCRATEHGFGIKNLQAFIKQRNGLLDIYEQDNLFCVHFIIPMII